MDTATEVIVIGAGIAGLTAAAALARAGRQALLRLEATCRQAFAAVDSVPPQNLELAGPLPRLAAALGLA